MAQRLKGLRKWMTANRINQARLAMALSKSQSQICRIFKGDQEFTLEDIYQLSLVTGLPIEELDPSGLAQRFIKLYGERLRSGVENAR